MDKMQSQKAEFDAVAELAKVYEGITTTAIVDGDYPMIRHLYEREVQKVIEAFKNNGRF